MDEDHRTGLVDAPSAVETAQDLDRSETATSVIDVGPILRKLSSNYPHSDCEMLQKALEFAREAHRGQLRASGEPYIIHPIGVAEILALFRMDCVTIVAGLLHDVMEDAGVTAKTLKHEFGEEVAFLVDGVTKVGRLTKDVSYEERQLENFRRLLVATAQDQRTVLIKLADRLHNMRTIEFLSREKRERVAQSTLDIYAPLAHRMGIGWIKDELEDLGLKYRHPEIYRELEEKVDQRTPEREEILNLASELLKKSLDEDHITADISKRVKHYYSIYKKMTDSQRGFDEIYDLLALRVITEKQSDCYVILGKAHNLWKPISERFKDFISVPKANGYRSLQTTVIGPKGRQMEIQIRTHDMHNVAENGIAAHWRYKRDHSDTTKAADDIRWLGQFSQDMQDTASPEEFMEALKVDLFAEEIVVFTPKGDLIQLPRGSTLVDFAYKIHTEIGDHCRAGMVNDKFMSLDYCLETGDRIEVITKKDAAPSREWLSFVKTARARSKIRRYLIQVEREKLLSMGTTLLRRELERAGIPVKTLENPEKMAKIYEDLTVRNLEELYIHVGFGRILTKHIISRLTPRTQISQRKTDGQPGPQGLAISGIDGYSYRRAHCCNPLPGDPIVGFVTKNRGISIHSAECQSLKSSVVPEERLLHLFWSRQDAELHSVEIGVEAQDRERLLSDITSMISATGTNIRGVIAHTFSDGTAKISFSLEVVDVDHLNRIINRVIPIVGVKTVIRRRKPTSPLSEPHSATKTKRKPPAKRTRKKE